MSYYSPSIEKLIEEFEKLPSIGHKTAVRLAFHVLNSPLENAEEFANSIVDARKNLKYLDLSNAKSLYISGSSGTSANNAAKSLSDTQNTQKMFKITKEGYIQEVKYLDENKKEITITQRPTAIHPINDNYICVGFGWSVGDMNTCYLVRKSDGAVFDMEKAGRPKKK